GDPADGPAIPVQPCWVKQDLTQGRAIHVHVARLDTSAHGEAGRTCALKPLKMTLNEALGVVRPLVGEQIVEWATILSCAIPAGKVGVGTTLIRMGMREGSRVGRSRKFQFGARYKGFFSVLLVILWQRMPFRMIRATSLDFLKSSQRFF